MAKPNLRISIPINPDELIALARKIAAKLTAAAESPLKALRKIDEFVPDIDTSDTENTLSKDLYRKAERATQDRDLALGQSGPLGDGTVRHYVTAARDLLQGIHKGNEQALGNLGLRGGYFPERSLCCGPKGGQQHSPDRLRTIVSARPDFAWQVGAFLGSEKTQQRIRSQLCI